MVEPVRWRRSLSPTLSSLAPQKNRSVDGHPTLQVDFDGLSSPKSIDLGKVGGLKMKYDVLDCFVCMYRYTYTCIYLYIYIICLYALHLRTYTYAVNTYTYAICIISTYAYIHMHCMIYTQRVRGNPNKIITWDLPSIVNHQK